MATSGADVAALRGFAKTLNDRRANIKEAVDQLTSMIQGLTWVGQDREQFVQDWEQIHRPGPLQILADLQDSSTNAYRYAASQENASQ